MERFVVMKFAYLQVISCASTDLKNDWFYPCIRRKIDKIEIIMKKNKKGKVYIIGAGPGDAGLITLKGH